MGNRTMFVAGLAVGYVLGTRAGREKYDQMVKMSQQVAGHPAVQKATQTVTTKTTEYTKTAVANAPGYAKSASAQVPKIVSSAKQMASSKFGGSGKGGASGIDDVGADGQLVYPAEEVQTQVDPVSGVRYTTGTT
jgi:hypothetical protein